MNPREAFDAGAEFSALNWEHVVTGRHEGGDGRSFCVQVNALDIDSRWDDAQLRAYSHALTEGRGDMTGDAFHGFVAANYNAVKEAHRFVRGVEESARLATAEGAKAMIALEGGDMEAALEHARSAEDLASPYGIVAYHGWREFRKVIQRS